MSEASGTIIIDLGSGDLYRGFPRVTVQLWMGGNPRPEQFIGTLPAAPALVELYRNWQTIYRGLCDRVARPAAGHFRDDPFPDGEIEELEISEAGITHISQIGFEDLCQQLQEAINSWLKSEGFLAIEYQLRSRLDRADPIRVIIETDDPESRALPWHRWFFFADYPKAEMALSQPEYQYRNVLKTPRKNGKVRILAVLGDSSGIDPATEVRSLQRLPDAEVEFLVNPSRQDFNERLWHPEGWDILFFAGHSQTLGQTGRIYINDRPTHNSLTIAQLEEALKTAIEKGLKLAIFNSCDGLGLARALEKLHIPTVIVMREPIPNRVAEEFFQQFLAAFALEQLPLYPAVQRARRKLQGLEDDFPAASWLPVICQNLAVDPPTWIGLGGIPPCPYRGLFAFREEDASFFFGRERVTRTLLDAAKRKPLVAVIGPSGSGKSSVVFAGLVPLLRREASVRDIGEEGPGFLRILSFRPGNNPLEALAIEMALRMPVARYLRGERAPSAGDGDFGDDRFDPSLAVELERLLRQDPRTLSDLLGSVERLYPTARTIAIIDQFEELYTLAPESDRQIFLDNLLGAARSAPTFTPILTLRADFCGHAFAYRPLSDALQDAIVILGPMDREELREAIEQPAARMGVKLAEGLIRKLVLAVDEQPGRLPLLEFALTRMWSNLRSGELTHEAYDEIGGVEGALANHAELVYARLEEDDRRRARQVFIQLVRPGEGTDDSRRSATRDDVGPENWDLVARLASSRLVVTNRNEATGEETVEIVHEALIRYWKRLRNWLESDREFRVWQEQVRANRYQWERNLKDEGALLRGKPLTDAEYWYMNRVDELSEGEREFIHRSAIVRDRERESQKRRQQRAIAVLAGGLVGALGLAGFAWEQWRRSTLSEIKALSASSEALFASENKLDALIEAIRAWKKSRSFGGVDAETGTLVGSVLQQAVYGVLEYNRLSDHGDEVKSVAFSPDGRTIATASGDKTIRLWKPDGAPIAVLDAHKDKVWHVAFSPDGQLLASASKDKTVILWKIEGGKKPIVFRVLREHQYDVRSVAFSPDGQLLASAGDDKTVRLWKRDGTLIATLAGHTGVVNAVAFSPDSQLVASADDDRTVKLWKRDGTLVATLTGHGDIVNGVAFSPDGRLLASAGWDKTIKLWRLASGKKPTLLKTLTGHSEVVYGVAFSPDGRTIASGGWDKTVRLWKRDGTPIATLNGHDDRVWGVAFSPDGRTIASTGGDKTIRLWKVKNPLLTRLSGHSAVAIGLAFSPDGQTIASTSDDKTIRLWKRDGTPIATLNGHTAQVYEVAFSPDGRTVASGAWDNTVELWNADGRGPRPLATLTGHRAAIFGVAFGPDGKTLVSTSADNTVKLWKFTPGRPPVLEKTLTGHTSQVYSVAFSPDGKTFATSSADNTVKLWKADGTLITTFRGHHAVVYSVAFSPDGQTIASASWDKTVKLWKPDGTLLTTLNGYSGRFWSIAFSPDGRTLAAANEDKTVILWDTDRVLSLNPLAYGCDWVRDYLKTNPDVSRSDRHLCDG